MSVVGEMEQLRGLPVAIVIIDRCFHFYIDNNGFYNFTDFQADILSSYLAEISVNIILSHKLYSDP